MLKTAKQTIAAYDMLRPDESVLVALSGGADSVALLRVLCELGYPVRAFHLNHCLRGAESERDETFCRALCARLEIALTVERIDIAAAAREQGSGVEETARRIRYARLQEAAQGAKIATAHTADDNLETVLFHLVRGTGPKGLAGIPPVRGQIIRPLLRVERAQVEAYLALLGQDYVTDSTNADETYTRNRIRHTVVPVLRAIQPSAAQAAVRLGDLLRQDEDCLGGLAQECLAQAAHPDRAWEIAPMRQAHPAVRARALRRLLAQSGMPLRDVTAQHVLALERLLESENPSACCALPHRFTARREYSVLRLMREENQPMRPAVPLSVPSDQLMWEGSVRVSVHVLENNEVFYKSFNTFCVDCGTIDFVSLCVRTRRAGDRIRLTEKGGSRTLKKLLIDRKIPRCKRDGLAVIADKTGVIAVQDIGMDCSRSPQGGARIQIKIEGY